MRTLAAEGPRGLLRGAGASALRDAPYAGIYMSAYQSFKRLGNSFSPEQHAIVNSVAAASAAGVAGIVTHPFDVLKVCIVEQSVRNVRN